MPGIAVPVAFDYTKLAFDNLGFGLPSSGPIRMIFSAGNCLPLQPPNANPDNGRHDDRCREKCRQCNDAEYEANSDDQRADNDDERIG